MQMRSKWWQFGIRSVVALLPVLDAGEREAIILASEQNADLLMMDDLAGRRAAMMYRINVMGTLGFLRVMYRKGRVKNLRDVLDEFLGHEFRMDVSIGEYLRIESWEVSTVIVKIDEIILFLFFGFVPNIIKKLCCTFYGLFISYPDSRVEFIYQLISR